MQEKQVQTQEKQTKCLIPNSNKTVEKKQRKRKSNYPLTLDEVHKLISETTNLRDRMFLELGLNTGMRVSEITSISIISIDWENGLIRIWDEKKDRYRNVIPPTNTINSLKLYVNELKGKGDRLFNFSKKTGERIIQGWSTRTLGKEKSWHCVRHSYVTLSRELNQDILIVQENTGDSLQTLLKVYSHPSPQTRRRLVDEKAIYKE